MIDRNLSIAIKELRNIDYDSYLSAIFTLKKNFSKIITVFLLQNQLKRIYYTVNDDMVGLVKLKWWKESLDAIFLHNKKSKNYLLAMISENRTEIDYQQLNNSITAFEKNFSENKKFTNAEELENYIFLTEGNFYLLAMEIIEHSGNEIFKNASTYLGKIFFYYDLIKKIKNENNLALRFFDSSFFNNLNNIPKDWASNPNEENLKIVINYIYFQILLNIQEFEAIEKELPKSCYHLVLKKDLVKIHLNNLKNNNLDIFKTNFSSKKFSTKIKFLLKVFLK